MRFFPFFLLLLSDHGSPRRHPGLQALPTLSIMDPGNFYDILGLHQAASQKDIEKAYKKQVSFPRARALGPALSRVRKDPGTAKIPVRANREGTQG